MKTQGMKVSCYLYEQPGNRTDGWAHQVKLKGTGTKQKYLRTLSIPLLTSAATPAPLSVCALTVLRLEVGAEVKVEVDSRWVRGWIIDCVIALAAHRIAERLFASRDGIFI